MDYLRYIVEQMHSVVMASVDKDDHPVTCAIDIMDYDEEGLYFLTARGKKFYERLKNDEHIAFTALRGKDTLSSVAVSLEGKTKEIGSERLDDLFQKNPYMHTIYPTPASRKALTVFRIYEGSGEYFDLSKQPIERASFAFGNKKAVMGGYFINERCIGCDECISLCPQNCIAMKDGQAVIQQTHCLHCGNCYVVCPVKAIERR